MATNNSINDTGTAFKTTAHTIDPGSSGDSYIQYVIDGNEFRIGCDDSDSDAFVLSQGSALGTTNTMRISSAGEVTLPLQPGFNANLTSAQNNVTGAGTTYTVVYDTEQYDKGSDYNGTSTFTAPVTGLYSFNFTASAYALTTSVTSGVLTLVTSNRSYNTVNAYYGNLYVSTGGNNFVILRGYTYSDMDAADTAHVTITVSGITDVVDVKNADQAQFDGQLMA